MSGTPEGQDKKPEDGKSIKDDNAKPDAEKDGVTGQEDTSAPIEVKAPEGMKVNEKVLGKFKEFATSKKLSQEDVNTLTSMQEEVQKEVIAEHQRTIDSWVDRSKADPEIAANDPEKWKVAQELGNAAIDAGMKAGGDDTREFVKLLTDYGLASHPGWMKMMMAFGKASQDPSFHLGGSKSPNLSPADRMWPGGKKGLKTEK